MSSSQTANQHNESSAQTITVSNAQTLAALITPVEAIRNLSIERATLPDIDTVLKAVAVLPNLAEISFDNVVLERGTPATFSVLAPKLKSLKVTGGVVTRESRTVNANITKLISAPNLLDIYLSSPALLPWCPVLPICRSTVVRNMCMIRLLLPNAGTLVSILDGAPNLETWSLCGSEILGQRHGHDWIVPPPPDHVKLTNLTLDVASSAGTYVLRWLNERAVGMDGTQVALECEESETVWDLDQEVFGSVRDLKLQGNCFADVSILCCLDVMRNIEMLTIEQSPSLYHPSPGKITDNLWSFIIEEDLLVRLKGLRLANLPDVTAAGLVEFVRCRSTRKQERSSRAVESGGPLATLLAKGCSAIGRLIIHQLDGWEVNVAVED